MSFILMQIHLASEQILLQVLIGLSSVILIFTVKFWYIMFSAA